MCKEAIRCTPAQTLRAWVGADAKVLSYLERELRAMNAPQAAPQDLPSVLRNGPFPLRTDEPWTLVKTLVARAAALDNGALPQCIGEAGPACQEAQHAVGGLDPAVERFDHGGALALGAARAGAAARAPCAASSTAQGPAGEGLVHHRSKGSKLPKWLNPAAHARPQLIGGAALPDAALAALLQMLSRSSPDAAHAGIEAARQALTGESLAVFAWDLFSMWLLHGAPAQENWVLWALGSIGSEECAPKLERLIVKWPSENACLRARAGIKALMLMDSPRAIVSLKKIARWTSNWVLRSDALEAIATIARRQGLTLEELDDRMVPSLGLDGDGGLELDYGPRRFRIGFDPFIQPIVRDSAGKRLKSLPRPKASDDPALASKARERWRALNEDVNQFSSAQIRRLENMLVTSRRIALEKFLQFFARRPLMRRLASRLVWGVYPGLDPGNLPETTFRLCEDLSAAGEGDESFDLSSSALAPGWIGVVHPIELSPSSLAAWRAVFADYRIAQPFAQLTRESYTLTEEEKQSSAILRFEGMSVSSASLRGALAQGWLLEGGTGYGKGSIHKDIELGHAVARAKLQIAHGAVPFRKTPSQALGLGKLSLFDGSRGATPEAALKFGVLADRVASEVLRIPSSLAAKGRKQ